MLLVYQDGTTQWRCQRCTHLYRQRFKMGARKKTAHINPPWGWAGDRSNAICDRCCMVYADDALFMSAQAVR